MLKDAIDILNERVPDEQFIQTLNDASNQHPYSSTIKTLLARATHLNDDVRFEDYVREAAIRAYNRKKLHDFVFAPLVLASEAIEQQEEKDQAQEKVQVQEVAISAVETKNEKPNNETIETDEQAIESAVEPTALVSENNNSDLTETETQSNEHSETAETSTEEEKISELEKQFLNEVLAAGAALELLQEEPEEEQAQVQEQSQAQVQEQNQHEVQAHSESKIEPKEIAEEKIEPINSENEKHSFSDWLGILDETNAEASTEATEVSEEKTISFQKDATKVRGKESIEKAADIISNFIENESQIVPKRAEFFNPSKAAKFSLRDNDDIVTETLANVYAAQGNISKAIATYEKLSLLHPEKSAYFAGLVKKLKRQQ